MRDGVEPIPYRQGRVSTPARFWDSHQVPAMGFLRAATGVIAPCPQGTLRVSRSKAEVNFLPALRQAQGSCLACTARPLTRGTWHRPRHLIFPASSIYARLW